MGSDHDNEKASTADVESNSGHEASGNNSPANGRDTEGGGFAMGCMPITRLGLRSAEFVFTLVCFSLLAAAQPPTGGLALKVGGVAYLLAFAVIACAYAIATIVLLVMALMNPESELSYKLPRPLLIADFILLVNLFAAASSCATAASLSACGAGQSSYLYYRVDTSYCGLIQGGAAMGFLASFTLMADFWLTLVPVFAEI